MFNNYVTVQCDANMWLTLRVLPNSLQSKHSDVFMCTVLSPLKRRPKFDSKNSFWLVVAQFLVSSNSQIIRDIRWNVL